MAESKKFVGGYDANYSRFLGEAIAKENRKRLNWFCINYDKLYANLEKEKIPKEAQKLKEIMERQKEAKFWMKQKVEATKEDETPKAESAVVLDVMKPVEAEVKEILYLGVSREEEGRALYLKTRNLKGPPEKFYMPECSSWVYGWTAKENEFHKQIRLSRGGVIERSFYRRAGVQADPEHYRPAVTWDAPISCPKL